MAYVCSSFSYHDACELISDRADFHLCNKPTSITAHPGSRMPNFITRLKRRTSSVASTNQVQTPPQNVPAMVTSPHVRAIHEEPPVDRRIHPDLNSLVADYDPPPRLPAGNVLSSAEVAADLSASSVADFVALQPSTRKQSMPDASIHHSPVPEPLSSTSVPETSSGASPGPSPSSSRKQGLLSRLANLSTGSSSSVPPSISALPPGGWSTFGRGRKETLPAPRDSAEFANSPRITSGSSSLPPSRTTSHSHHTGIETQPQTPTSASHSHSYTTPQSQSHSSHNHTRTTPVSPHTFGNSTPPSSGFTFGSRGHHSPPYIHGQTPPPLPPLNHPAFRLPTSSTFNASRARDVLAALSDEGSLDNAAMQQKVPRLSLSMPSMSQPRHASLTGSTRSTTRIKRMSTRSQSRLRTRTYSKVKAMEIFPVSTSRSSMEIHESTSRRHSRTKSSSSSKISDRRASADFSAIQASALGHSRGDSWEAQVAERIVRMSLGEQGWPEDNAHKRPVADRVRDAEDLTGLGQARGNNVGDLVFASHLSVVVLLTLLPFPFPPFCIPRYDNSRSYQVQARCKALVHHFYCNKVRVGFCLCFVLCPEIIWCQKFLYGLEADFYTSQTHIPITYWIPLLTIISRLISNPTNEA